MELLQNPVVIWAGIGFIFFILELIVPGLVLMFFGAGAWIVALYTLLFDATLEQEIIIFLVSSLLLLFALRKQLQKKFFKAKDGVVDVYDDDFIGHSATALTSFGKNEFGKVQFKGAPWKAISDFDITEGQVVEIVKADSITLIVKPKNKIL